MLPDEAAKKLSRTLALVNSFHDGGRPLVACPGDMVRWKPGMRNRTWPRDGEIAVVVEQYGEPLWSDVGNPCDDRFGERLDLALAYTEGGTLRLVHVDSRRFDLIPDREAAEIEFLIAKEEEALANA